MYILTSLFCLHIDFSCCTQRKRHTISRSSIHNPAWACSFQVGLISFFGFLFPHYFPFFASDHVRRFIQRGRSEHCVRHHRCRWYRCCIEVSVAGKKVWHTLHRNKISFSFSFARPQELHILGLRFSLQCKWCIVQHVRRAVERRGRCTCRVAWEEAVFIFSLPHEEAGEA